MDVSDLPWGLSGLLRAFRQLSHHRAPTPHLLLQHWCRWDVSVCIPSCLVSRKCIFSVSSGFRCSAADCSSTFSSAISKEQSSNDQAFDLLPDLPHKRLLSQNSNTSTCQQTLAQAMSPWPSSYNMQPIAVHCWLSKHVRQAHFFVKPHFWKAYPPRRRFSTVIWKTMTRWGPCKTTLSVLLSVLQSQLSAAGRRTQMAAHTAAALQLKDPSRGHVLALSV